GVEAEGCEQLDVRLAAAGGEEREIALDKTLARPLVKAVERVHQAVAESVGIDVERRVDEVRDVGPESLISGSEADRRPEALGLHRHPEVAEGLRRQFALAAFQM